MQSGDKKLFVEGVNDREVVYRVENFYGLRDICEVKALGSKDGVRQAIELHLNEMASKVKTIGAIVDADLDMPSSWASIKSSIDRTGNYTAPKAIPLEGLILDPIVPDNPKVGIWIMPDNSRTGMLEDFMKEMIPQDDNLLGVVSNTLDDLESNHLQRYKAVHRSKAWIHTYLAWQDEPGNTLATAVDQNLLNPRAAIVKSFAEWMRLLFA